MLATFLVLRYRYRMEGITRAFAIGAVLDTAAIVALGVWDYVETGRVSSYTIFVAAIVIYGLTAGRNDLRRVDHWMAQRVRPSRRVTC
jgi:hypothetical protein